jgi:glucose/arabinose dehydrogenase
MSCLAFGVMLLLAQQGEAPSSQPASNPWTDAFVIESIAMPPGIDPQIGGIDALPNGKLAICCHRGEVMLFDPSNNQWSQFAEGLHEPLGVLAESDDSLLVMQRSELTRLRDTDGDGQADSYETVYDGFGLTGNYHEFAFGPARDAEGNLYVALNLASNGAGIREEIRGQWTDIGVERMRMAVRGKPWAKVQEAAGRMYSRVAWRGWVLKLSPDGEQVTPFACGFRSPDGIGFDQAGRLLVTDNQGDWLGTSKVHHVREGLFHGHPASLVWRDGWQRNPLEVPVAELQQLRTKAMALLPQGELASSPTQPIAVPEGMFGPFAGHTLIGEMNQKTLVRLLPDVLGEVSQGAAIPFLQCEALGAGNHRMVFTKDGSLWIGKTHLSWAGADGLVRVRPRPQATMFSMAQVRAVANGFRLRFTDNVAVESLARVKVRAHGYHYHKAYGSPKVNDREVAVTVSLDAAATTLQVALSDLREGDVYTISLTGVTSSHGAALLGDKVYYTLLKKR